MTSGQTREKIPAILERVGFHVIGATSRWRTSRGACSRRSRCAGALTPPVVLLLDEPTTGLDPRSKLEVQDFIRERDPRTTSTSCSARTDLAEAECPCRACSTPTDVCSCSPADEIKRRYEATTLEEAFFAATGRAFEAEADDEDDDREVMA